MHTYSHYDAQLNHENLRWYVAQFGAGGGVHTQIVPWQWCIYLLNFIQFYSRDLAADLQKKRNREYNSSCKAKLNNVHWTLFRARLRYIPGHGFLNCKKNIYMSESEILGTFQNGRMKCYFLPLFSTGYIKNGLRCL